MRLKISIIAKLSCLVVALVAVTAAGVNEIYVRGGNRILVADEIRHLEKETGTFRYPLDGFIEQLRDSARFLSQLEGVEAPTGAAADKLAVIFTEMIRTKEQYHAIALIGADGEGREIVRVERYGNRIDRTPESKLQPRAAEPYFQHALGLDPGDIYLSNPMLERNNGKVAEPHMLLLRAAAPVYDEEKNLTGIVLIDMDFGSVLKDIQHNLLESRTLYITDSRGNYLVHPDAARLYGGDLGTAYRLQADVPDVISPDVRDKDIFTLLPRDTEHGNVFSFQRYRYDPLDHDNFLGIAIGTPYREITDLTRQLKRLGFLMSFVTAALAVVAAIVLLRLLIRPLNRIADAVVHYRKGEKNISLPVESPDEIGVLAREFQAMMRTKDEEDWAKENLVRISRNLIGFKDMASFADTLMQLLTLALDAQGGAFYVSSSFDHHQERGETESLTLLGTSAYAGRAGMKHEFKWGEGLVGQCAKDRTVHVLSDIPDDYLYVESSLGKAQPRFVLLQPVLFENSLVGVIELASIAEFSEVQRGFLEQLSFSVGVIVNSISAGMRTQELLEETRMAAEELQRNEEELKTQQEELQVSNEEMEEKARLLEEQNEQIKLQSRSLAENKRELEQKARELELSNKYKSEFLANMSHELRTPLNSLLILSRSLSGNEDGNLTEEQVEEARVIHNGGLELLGLINDILDLSKVEAGKLSIMPDDVSPRDIVIKIAQQFEPVSRDKGLPFRIETANDIPALIHTDPQRVEQILKNLLSNAFKFTESGSVTLSISSRAEGRSIAFSVIDTGIGIEESKLRDIFEAFQQEDGSTDRHYGGTGLGLTIARKFAHMLGGEISVTSKKGEGSVFTLTLPSAASGKAAKKQEEAAPQAKEQSFIADDRDALKPGDKVLLVIEDDPAFASTLMKIARKRGYKTIVAGDGKNGVLLADFFQVSAIILDLKLPDIDGINVLDQLKHNLRTRHIPVHIISGRMETDSVVPLRKGAIGYLIKPARTEDIERVFQKIESLAQGGVKKILVVEDDRKTQAAIHKIIKKKDVEIEFAATGNAARKKLLAGHYDCVILDLRLPDMTGFSWLEMMENERGETEMPPVIVYTAQDLTEEENRTLSRYTGSIVIKGASSSERLLDEVTLFLHSVEATLPDEQQAIIRMQHDPDRMLQDRHVLLVDDDLRNSFALSKLLKKHGMHVTVADNGQMALEKLKENKAIELVIMDIMMPVMDGYEAMRIMRSNAAYKKVPVIALTARAMPEEQDKCMEAGANDYLTKPVDVDRLLSLVRVWLFRQESAA